MPDRGSDLLIIGAGIVGLATALEVTRRFPQMRLIIVDKEDRVAAHQTGHNSGVIHSGLYYKTGSLKARNCVAGAASMKRFCQEHGVVFEECGKLVVATTREEVPRLEDLHQRGAANGVPGLRMLQREQFREIEPHCAGICALQVPSTGIVDYTAVAQKYSELIQRSGGEIVLGAKVVALRQDGGTNIVETRGGTFRARYVINCAGLYSDTITRMAGVETNLEIIPFRGEYYEVRPERRNLVKALIYPVPDPRFPFLGVHFTRRVNGSVEAGPNALLAFRREGYTGAPPDIGGSDGDPALSRLLEDGPEILAHGAGGTIPLLGEIRIREGPAENGAGASGIGPGAGRIGSARAGGRRQRQPGRRLPFRPQREHDSRVQCAFAGGNRLARDRQERSWR
jgi:(S)-2-hydroxyglutarate dehydrogenase